MLPPCRSRVSFSGLGGESERCSSVVARRKFPVKYHYWRRVPRKAETRLRHELVAIQQFEFSGPSRVSFSGLGGNRRGAAESPAKANLSRGTIADAKSREKRRLSYDTRVLARAVTAYRLNSSASNPISKLVAIQQFEFYFLLDVCKQWNALSQDNGIDKQPIAVNQAGLNKGMGS